VLRSPLVAFLAWALVAMGAGGAFAFVDEGNASQAAGASRAWLNHGASACIAVIFVGAALAVLNARERA